MKKKAIKASIVVLIAAAMILPVGAMMQTPYTYGKEQTSTLEVSRGHGSMHMDLSGSPVTVSGKEVKQIRGISPNAMLDGDVQVTNGDGPEVQPAISTDGAGTMFIGVIADFGSGLNAYFTGSADGGATWADNAVAWGIDTPEYPSVDYWGNGIFYGTMVPSSSAADGSELYILNCTNPLDFDNGYSMVYWDWNDVGDGYTDFKAVDIGCDNGVEDYAYGGVSIIGNHGSGLEETPFFSYQATAEGTAWIYTFTDVENSFTIEHCLSTAMTVDHSTHYAYPMWTYLNPNSGLYDIYTDVFDFGTWDDYQGYPIHPDIYSVYINDSAVSTEYIDVSAYNDNVIMVAQTSQYGAPNKDITCYYSHDGLNTIQTSTIAASPDSELHPKVVHTGDDQAICIFVKNGNIYSTTTDDGGATWTDPEQINDEDGTVEEFYSEKAPADLCKSGAIWSDERGSSADIYYDSIEAPGPILSIESVSGGFGVTATVSNTGSEDASNVDWTISFDGGVFVGNEKTGTVTVPAGGEATVKTGFIFGVGKTTASVNVGGATEKISGFVLGPLVLGVK
ncbi:MAG: hypothetical protein J7L93_00680 [Thermoplasmata archaeon]|nr:hypothetical protein [Thermoplasmata archaeon]